MPLVELIKKGGPYTKKEQEERKIQVYQLHFEENKSAVQIAELLNVHRNTINEDIHYWNQKLASRFTDQDLTRNITKQIQRMEIQRDRLLDYLEETESLDEKIRVEKFISDLTNRLTQVFSKMIFSKRTKLEYTEIPKEIDESEIKEFVMSLISRHQNSNSKNVYSEKQLKSHLIKKTKCNVVYADHFVEKMKQDGLILCEQSNDTNDLLSTFTRDFSPKYDMTKFANLRGYINN